MTMPANTFQTKMPSPTSQRDPQKGHFGHDLRTFSDYVSILQQLRGQEERDGSAQSPRFLTKNDDFYLKPKRNSRIAEA